MRFAFIAEEAGRPVSLWCRVLGVSRTGYYAWRGRSESRHARDDRRLAVLVPEAHERSRGTYGSPRVHAELVAHDEHVSRKRVIRLMQQEGLKARVRRRYKCTTMSDHNQPIAPNLLDRRFEADTLSSSREKKERGNRARVRGQRPVTSCPGRPACPSA